MSTLRGNRRGGGDTQTCRFGSGLGDPCRSKRWVILVVCFGSTPPGGFVQLLRSLVAGSLMI
jgi:hypothetical protein